MHRSLLVATLSATLVAGIYLMCPEILLGQLDPESWRIVNVSSENVITGEHARYAIDGDAETQWHTRWHASRDFESAAPPHSLTIDLAEDHAIEAIRYRARAHGEGGLPKDYSLSLSLDGVTWEVVADGQFEFRSQMTPHAVISLDMPVRGRFLQLTISSLHESGRSREPGLVVAELDVGTVESPLLPTTLTPIPQSREWNYGGYDWKQRHREILAYNARTKPRLLFLGDSITHRWGAPPLDSSPRTGEAIWQKYYAHRNAANLGYGWDRVENMLWRLKNGELDNTDPRLVVVLAGTNNVSVNSPAEIAVGVGAICDEIHRQKPDATILLLAIFPRGGEWNAPVSATNELISELGDRTYVIFRDIGTVFLDQAAELTTDVMPDLLHPGEDGYRRWAAAIEADVSRILGDSPVVP